MLERKTDYYGCCLLDESVYSAGVIKGMMFKQENDWTCTITCLKTILNLKESEEELVGMFNFTVGPHYVDELIQLPTLNNVDIISSNTQELTPMLLTSLLNNGYSVMVEWCLNYAHWCVVLGYYVLKDDKDLDGHIITMYDPYYDEIRLFRSSEFFSMYIKLPDLTPGEFLAIKQ